jgi:hypothetical protein
MKFEELESVWALQQPAKTLTADLPALRRALQSQLNRRQRMLIYAGASLAFSLIAMQVLFFVNLRVTRVEDQWLFFVRLMLNQGVSLVIVLELVRVFLRHRRLARGRAESVRDVVSLSLTVVETEMADYRLGRWVTLVLVALSLFSAYLNQRVTRVGWNAFGLRAGLIIAVYGLLGLLFWRQYRRKLLPEQDRLRTTLEQLEKTGE